MKKQFRLLSSIALLLLSCLLIFNSCKKDKYNSPADTGPTFNNSQMTNATFLGQVVKEDGTPLDGATVSTGMHSFTTDADGFFYFSDISTPLKATMIKVEKAGYFEAFRTLRVIPNQDNQTRIMIMELPQAETFSASAGGLISISNGGSILFPANGIIDELTNQTYTGNVNVYAKWIDPTSSEIGLLMPGALRGVNEEGSEQSLATYGMQAVELRGDAGQALQLASGQKAEVRFPLPADLQGAAPANVPLWSLNEENGMWVEEGNGVKVGNEYLAEVPHFSFWNIDWPVHTTNFTCTLVDPNNNPISGAWVVLDPQSFALSNGYSMTNSNGVVSGQIPLGETYDLRYIPTGCPANSPSTFVQTFIANSANFNLGNIVVSNSAASPAVISGTVQDCNAAILANAPVKLALGSNIYMGVSDASGQFSFTVNCLTAATNGVLTAYDNANLVNGSMNIVATPSVTNNVGIIQACGTLNGFINWSSTVGSVTTNASINEGINGANLYQSFQFNTDINGSDSLGATSQYIGFSFDGPQTVAGAHTLVSYFDYLDMNTIQNISGTPTVTLTNYQAVGGWIEGSFTATITSATIPSRTVVCTFRVQRQL